MSERQQDDEDSEQDRPSLNGQMVFKGDFDREEEN
jgi:hypothetical protein